MDSGLKFLKPYSFLMNTHVVNIFNDRLWEAIDKDWLDSLLKERVQNLLHISYKLLHVLFRHCFFGANRSIFRFSSIFENKNEFSACLMIEFLINYFEKFLFDGRIINLLCLRKAILTLRSLVFP